MKSMKRRFQSKRGKMNNKGSAMLLVLTVISLIAILGFISLSAAAAAWQMQALRRKSEKNFYFLETALDEIYSGLGQTAGDAMETGYEKVLGGLYTTYKTNDEANSAFSKIYLEELEETLGVSFRTGLGEEADMAEKLKSYSATIEKEKLTVEIGDIFYADGTAERVPEGMEDGTEKETEEGRQQVTLKDLCLTYVNPETKMESSITVDLALRTPRIRFINEKEALQDYILVANNGIRIEEKAGAEGETLLKGNIYGGNIQVSNTKAVMESNLITAGEELAVNNGGSLLVVPRGMDYRDEDSGENGGGAAGDGGTAGSDSQGETYYAGTSHIWAHNVSIFQASNLEIDRGNMYVRDDTTLRQDGNFVKLSGGYYGYGNEGERESSNPSGRTHTDSSAILLNGKRNTVDFKEADTVLLAGRAYLNFRDISEAYPLGESMSVKASQNIYLVPVKTVSGEAAVEVKTNGDSGGDGFSMAGSNPLSFPEGTEKILVRVKKTNADGSLSESGETGTYQVVRTENAGTVSYSASHTEGVETAVIVGVKGKLYIYRSFGNKEEQNEYFREYVANHGETFAGYLKNAGMGTVNDSGQKEGSISLNGGGNFYTAASLYEVSGEGESVFRLVNNDMPASLGIVELSNSCSAAFENLKTYLAETEKPAGSGKALPASTYVRLKLSDGTGTAIWDMADFEGIYEKNGEEAILVTNQDVTLDTEAGRAEAGAVYDMPYGLIVTSGNVTVKGGSDNEWRGLILAGGTITLSGKANLTADAQNYASYMEDERTAKYFYGCSDTDSAVFRRYEDFLIMKNWEKGTRKYGE